MFEDALLLIYTHPQSDARDERRALDRASFCLLDHRAYYSIWDRCLCPVGDEDTRTPWQSESHEV
jgi:hypothetical protein